jgi:uncharacterized membrane protein
MSSSDALWNHQSVAIWLIVAALAVLVILSVRRENEATNGAQEAPEEVLKLRYAKGEIDEATYEHMLEQLRK